MNTKEINMAAYLGNLEGESLDKLKPSEKLLYYQLQKLYLEHKNGLISKETAAEQKKICVNEYERNATNELNGSLAFLRIANMYKLSEKVISDYKRNRTLENADKLVDIINGRLKEDKLDDRE